MLNALNILSPAVLLCVSLLSASCNGSTTGTQSKNTQGSQSVVSTVTAPDFSADSAYSYVKQQLGFGPRVPGSKAHSLCLEFFKSKLQSFGINTTIQKGEGVNYLGKPQPVFNVIGKINPECENRIVLCSHWDSRPWADMEPSEEERLKPIDGANDGASGVGVLLEAARQFMANPPKIGVDIIFFDVEDLGMPDFLQNVQYRPDTWCIGSQYWAQSTLAQNNFRYAILLDMVGAPDATFHHEQYSLSVAPGLCQSVWSRARNLGHGNYFINAEGGYITDDHYYIHRYTGMQVLDIIDYKKPNSFGSYWHTHADNLNAVSKTTLQAVGETILSVVYDEK